MNRLLLLAFLSLTAGCQSGSEPPAPPAREPLVPPRMPGGHATSAQAAPAGSFQGRVAETMDAGPYTYLRVESGTRSAWAAAPQMEVAVGETVRFSTSMPMASYESQTLARIFDVVYFTQGVERLGTSGALPPGHPPTQTQPAGHGRSSIGGAAAVELEGIERPEGGLRISEVHERAAGLAGERVLVRGRVVKFTPGVMDSNWLHLQDGTGHGETADLTVVSDGVAEVGELVSAWGVVTVEQDFGFGYRYAVLLQDALLTVE